MRQICSSSLGCQRVLFAFIDCLGECIAAGSSGSGRTHPRRDHPGRSDEEVMVRSAREENLFFPAIETKQAWNPTSPIHIGNDFTFSTSKED
jgi:hypothetical protein